MSETRNRRRRVEWPTLGLMITCYAIWAIGTTWASALWLPLGMVVTIPAVALYSSLCHEALHGHPTRHALLNEALVFPSLTLCIPYQRFRDTHLAHHQDAILTDPYDDPESNYQDPKVWDGLPEWARKVLRFNNTLVGRLLIGPAVGQYAFTKGDWQAIKDGDRVVLIAWLWHIPAVALVSWWLLSVANMPVWAYLICAYAGLAILKIRTFLEHQAHLKPRARTVVIEDKGPLALLFLNNNLHVVHHMHPKMPWYRLPRLFADNRDRYLARNDAYYYRSYGEIFRRYFWNAKDPVPHPFWPRS